jgi:hypothetical protein
VQEKSLTLTAFPFIETSSSNKHLWKVVVKKAPRSSTWIRASCHVLVHADPVRDRYDGIYLTILIANMGGFVDRS